MNGQFNNLTLSNDLLITGNIQSSGNIDTDNINCEAITSKSLTCDNININNNMTLNKLSTSRLDLISAIPIDFFNGGINYNLTSSHLKSLYDLGGGDVASKAYVDKQINDLISAAPDMLNTFSEIASRIQTDETIRDSILVQLSKKATLDSDNVYTGGLNTFNNNVKILGSLNGHDLDSELGLLESDIVNLNTSITALNTQLLNKANTTNPQFNNYVYVNNNANGSMLPSVNNGFLAIGANVSGSGETNFINTGVPHAVVFVEGLNGIDVETIGREIRNHPFFAPKGTNVNFVEISGDQKIVLRTYERGVEAETLACGTGTVASSIISDISVNGLVSRKSNFIEAKTKSGEALKVHFDIEGKMVKNVWLEGKSQLVFEGTIKNV